MPFLKSHIGRAGEEKIKLRVTKIDYLYLKGYKMCKLRFEYSSDIPQDKKQEFEDRINEKLSRFCEELNKSDSHIQVSVGKDGAALRGLIIGPESIKLSLQNRHINLDI